MDVLIVDGYNIIGAWDELKRLKKIDLGQARDRLIDLLADYQSYSGMKVVIVFDAHDVPGLGSKASPYKIEIIYTKENETADECIEKLVTEYKKINNQVYVATSDYLEQRITFGRGALRKSARELWIDVQHVQTEIRQTITSEQTFSQKPSNIKIQRDVLEVFEKWRRRK